MKRILLVSLAIATAGVSACNRTHTDTEATAVTPAPDPAAAPVQGGASGADALNQPTLAGRTTAPGFVARATLSDLYEIESSRLALERTQSATVRAYAQMMVDAHTGTSRQLTELLRTSGSQITPQTSLDREGSDRMADLRSAPAERFDALYLEQQAEAHQTTLALMRDYASGGDTPVLQAFARQTAPIVEQHLTQVRTLVESVGPGAAPAAAAPSSAAATPPSASAPPASTPPAAARPATAPARPAQPPAT